LEILREKVFCLEQRLTGDREHPPPNINDKNEMRVKLTNLERKLDRLSIQVKQFEQSKSIVTPDSHPGGATGGAMRSGSDMTNVSSVIRDIEEKLVVYEGVLTVLNREIEKLSTQVCSN